jgi:hypothetical protein
LNSKKLLTLRLLLRNKKLLRDNKKRRKNMSWLSLRLKKPRRQLTLSRLKQQPKLKELDLSRERM